MPLSTSVQAKVIATSTGTIDLGAATIQHSAQVALTLANGTGASQADKVWSDERTLAASASEELDLAGGLLLDPFGVAVTLVRLKVLYVEAIAGNTNDVIVGGATPNGFVGGFGAAAHTWAVSPGGVFLAVAPGAGWLVTAGTGDLLKILNGGAGTGVTYRIVLVGTSA
jgi:phage-related minor tail protein